MRWICLLLWIWGVHSIKTNTTTAENDLDENASIKSYFESSTYVLLAPAPPVITSSSRTSDPNSYLLSWKRDKLEGFLSYKIRYIKTDHLSNFTLTRGEISKLWSYASVVSNFTSYLLNNLHPSSLYQVEMVGVTRNATSQLAVSSFRTGLEKPQFQIPIFNSNTTSSKHKKNQKKTQKFGFGGLPPESPSTPTVTELSATSVSLMWYPRFNGGSPITEYQCSIIPIASSAGGYVSCSVTSMLSPITTCMPPMIPQSMPFNVQSRIVGEGGWKEIEQFIPADSTTCIISELKRGSAYKFRVISVNGYGKSPPSSSTETHYTDLSYVMSQTLMTAPEIVNVASKNWSQVEINWIYEESLSKKLNGFLITYWPSNRRKKKHKKKRLKKLSATSYVIESLKPGFVYTVKLQAFNRRGKSPSSNLVEFEMPTNRSSPLVVIQGLRGPDPTHNDVNLSDHLSNRGAPGEPYIDDGTANKEIRDRISRRDAAFLIAGAALVFVIIALVASGIVYRRSMSNIKKLLGRKPNSDKNSTNGAASSTPPADEYLVLNGGNPPYCECDEHSKHGDDRNHGDHILYCEHQECFSSAPLWWVRGEDGGEFCHIVPADAKRQTPVAPACGADATPHTAMVTRTYAGNVAGGYLSNINQSENNEIVESAPTINIVQVSIDTEQPQNTSTEL